MLRALRGEPVDRPPVWMMRQAGRYMKVYQELCKKHKTFRERSENVDIAVEVSLQPWRAFRPDGVILFSDILTPIAGMNIPFDIVAGKGPVIFDPIRTMKQVIALRNRFLYPTCFSILFFSCCFLLLSLTLRYTMITGCFHPIISVHR